MRHKSGLLPTICPCFHKIVTDSGEEEEGQGLRICGFLGGGGGDTCGTFNEEKRSDYGIRRDY